MKEEGSNFLHIMNNLILILFMVESIQYISFCVSKQKTHSYHFGASKVTQSNVQIIGTTNVKLHNQICKNMINFLAEFIFKAGPKSGSKILYYVNNDLLLPQFRPGSNDSKNH